MGNHDMGAPKRGWRLFTKNIGLCKVEPDEV